MTSKTLGIALIIIGALMMIYTGFNYVTTQKVVDVGPLKIEKEKNHIVQWPPVIGGALLLTGIVTLARNKKGA